FDSFNLDQVKDQLKYLYDQLKNVECNFQSDQRSTSTCSTLPELITKQLDEEQIWQQLELQNSAKLNKIRRKANNILDRFDKIDKFFYRKDVEKVNFEANKSSGISQEEADIDGEDEDPEQFFDVENDDDEEEGESNTGEGSRNNPEFFDEKEMEEFLDKQEKLEAGGGLDKEQDDNDSDLEDEESDEDIEGLNNYKYKDFFGRSNDKNSSAKKKVRFGNQDSAAADEQIEEDIDDASTAENENIGEKDSQPKSTFEIRQAKLKESIEEYEQRNLGDKPWQQTGEVWAKNRPENSLLEEYVEFEHTTRLAPVITQETTQSLEDLIKQRIKDKAWDDVERKEQKEEIKDEQQEEVRRLMRELFVKLDALTNYHFTPKLPQNEIKIVNNTKSIVVEEVAPLTVNDADMLAPEERTKRKGQDADDKEAKRTKVF
uniref:U3 small nucleolar ribonucleoprotein protein MPP10 n=1 Tax=Romanomermis culicivorax TaxID=13658 RepID=A0A915HIY3_ROMCU